jgi:4-methylaminobutanoate oxidase (formaldehyde-forming)
LVSLKFHDEKAMPLGHEPIYYDGNIIGKISSCAFGYRIGKPAALGTVQRQTTSGIAVQVDIARQFFDATLVTNPLYDPEGIRMKS